MAVGKSKVSTKGGRKIGKRKQVDPFLKKEWYDIKAPSMFNIRQVGKTLITRTQGTKIASDGLKGRVFEVSLADLQADESRAFRKMRLRVEEVQGRSCLTNFWGMTLTTDRLRKLVKKSQTLIEAFVDVKTTDGYTLRLFCIGFTKHQKGQVSKTCYCKASQAKLIRKKMTDIMRRESEGVDLKDLVSKFIPESIGPEIEKACQSIFPLHEVCIRKVKVLKAPKFDITRLMELHTSNEGATSGVVGGQLKRPQLIEAAEDLGEIEGQF